MSEEVRVGINGLGRIGRCVLRLAEEDDSVSVVGVNDLASPEDIAYLLRHDSVHGPFPTGPVEASDSKLTVGEKSVPFTSEEDPSSIPWPDMDARVVIEATGAFRGRDDAARHLRGPTQKVIISAPSDDADVTIVPGVNDDVYRPDGHHVISAASCTTNCVAPVLHVLDGAFGVETAAFTTVHAYTSSQNLVDAPSRKRARGRAAAVSLVPTSTGAAQATEQVLPQLAGRLHGMAIRAPIPDGSVTDLVVGVARDVQVDGVRDAIVRAASSMEHILGFSADDLVSVDIVGDTRSAIVDGTTLAVLGSRQIKLLAWYDNEMGYAARLLDLARRLGD